jgi:hypothetical protein
MGALDQLESFLQEVLERPAWLLGARRLQPAQLAGAISRELEERARRLPDRIVVPSSFVVSLAADDFAQIEPRKTDLEAQLAEYVERVAAERDLSLPADPEVRIYAEPSLRPGHIAARASFPTLAQRETPLAALRRATRGTPSAAHRDAAAELALLGLDGEPLRSFPLRPPAMTIGRRSDNDISLADLNLSRYHAELRTIGRDWYLSDLGSTNGTRVNGEALSGRRKLRPGDIIELGLQRLRFER